MTNRSKMKRSESQPDHNEMFRDPMEVICGLTEIKSVSRNAMDYEVQGSWWDILQEFGITLLATREYEHLVLALQADDASKPNITMLRIPHPSGLAVDRVREKVFIACTRNPNQVFGFAPSQKLMHRLDVEDMPVEDKPLMPTFSRFYPGCLYLHDLALIGDDLYANSVGQNAVVRFESAGLPRRVWWPKCIETGQGPVFGRNHLQLNSIAAGKSIKESFFSASTDELSFPLPGDPNFSVDRRGVIFAGASREVVARGLTRPHSARIYDRRLWVDNSGYGEVGYIEDGEFHCLSRLPGWTRGLCFFKDVMFVGTSKVLPRFRGYAPGLDIASSNCGIYAVDIQSAKILGSIVWPSGDQIFSLEWMPQEMSKGFAFRWPSDGSEERIRKLFYSYHILSGSED